MRRMFVTALAGLMLAFLPQAASAKPASCVASHNITRYLPETGQLLSLVTGRCTNILAAQVTLTVARYDARTGWVTRATQRKMLNAVSGLGGPYGITIHAYVPVTKVTRKYAWRVRVEIYLVDAKGKQYRGSSHRIGVYKLI